ncbi:MAG: preprotein translocase subunit SecA [Candidatus Moranbacteria bacterium]|nr:preprotein translocase subunit SecA [Candidatus Moranbacteria bacterium]
MLNKIFKKMFGSEEREIQKIKPILEKVNQLEEETKKLSDDQLREKTKEFQNRFAKGESLEDLLPEAFAVVREGAQRVIGQRHFDVQILGGIVLHNGKIAEMKTGEGKTLTSTLPIYLNAITKKGVHVVTVNDYLARRDCNWMGAVYHFLGLSTACIVHDQAFHYEPRTVDDNEVSVEKENLIPVSRKEAYAADITYGTNNEFGFDHLRDNMVQQREQMVQRDLNYAIVDEVDSILIDESRTPLIISAPDTESTKLYGRFAQIVPRLEEKKDYDVDEKLRAVTLTEDGISKVEQMVGVKNLYDPSMISYVHVLEQSLRAGVIFQRDKDYVVKDNQVIIVDDFTGRLMEGRRYSEGLHQAIEAKEGVAIQKESRTLATITFQNYFRMYEKLAGMTGTALSSAEEFAKVYKIDVVAVPTHRPMVRRDEPDVIYKNEKGKLTAITQHIKELNKTGQPVLVGTVAIEKSEVVSKMLTKAGVPHEVLNAKNHEREAAIIANAGVQGSVTIATNMAGRGTDIKITDEVRNLGGLCIIGTERHEARRIDNQLRGRAGRQGDPGMSQFYVSLDDELMRRFGGDKLKNMMTRFGLPDDQPIQNKMISRAIENAQTKIEGFNFDIRKHVLDYDDVVNKQRTVVYKRRRAILDGKHFKDAFFELVREECETIVAAHVMEEDGWEIEVMFEDIGGIFPLPGEIEKKVKELEKDQRLDAPEKKTRLVEVFVEEAKKAFYQKEQEIGQERMPSVVRSVFLRTIDTLWMNHLDEMEYLRQGIGLRGYGQRDPLIEYKKEAHTIFSGLMANIRSTTVKTVFHVAVTVQVTAQTTSTSNMQFSSAPKNQSQLSAPKEQTAKGAQQPIVKGQETGRNEPCHCGSGKKYKKCHGKETVA